MRVSLPNFKLHRLGGISAIAMILVLLVPTAAFASVIISNYMSTVFGVVDSPVSFLTPSTETYDTKLWNTQTDFDDGTVTFGAETIASGAVTLKRPTNVDPDFGYAPWWDEDWLSRECFDIDHSGGIDNLIDHPVRVVPTSTDASGVSLRAIAADGSTALSFWEDTAGTIGSGAVGDVYVKIPSTPAGSTTFFCLYYDHEGSSPPLGLSDMAATLNGTLTDGYVQLSGAATQVTVASYSDGNLISNGTDYAYLDAGESRTFTANNGVGTVFSSLAPINSRGIGNGNDMLVPLWWQGTEFIVPTQRSVNLWHVYNPGAAAATVRVYQAATLITTVNVPAGTATSIAADIPNGGNVRALITSTEPIVAGHVAGTNDALAAYPSISSIYGDTTDVYGVNSTRVYYGSNTNGNVLTVSRSDGTTETPTVNANIRVRSSDLGASQGGDNRDAYRITSTAPIGAIQQADSDGGESTMFLPIHQLSNEYIIAAGAQYLAFACPTSGTVIDIGSYGGATASFNCNDGVAALPDKLRLGAYPLGTHVRSQGGEPFFMYYEYSTNNDETAVVGPGMGEPTPLLLPVITSHENTGIYAAFGFWESDLCDTAVNGNFGEISWTATLPTSSGNALRFQIASSNSATGPFTYLGPDGTAATSYEAPPTIDDISTVHDGDRYFKVTATLIGGTDLITAPVLDEVAVEYNGVIVAGAALPDPVVVPVAAGTPTSQTLADITANGFDGDGYLEYVSSTNLANISALDLQLDGTSSQIIVATGSVTQTVGLAAPFLDGVAQTIDLDVTATNPGITTTITFIWRGIYDGTGPAIEHEITLEIQS